MADIALRVVGGAAGFFVGNLIAPGVGGPYGASIGYGIGGAAAGFLFPTKRPPIYIPAGAMDRHVMLASFGTPLGIIYGTARKQINLVWAQPIQTHTDTTTQQTSKGGGQEQQVVTEWKSATFFGVASEGPALGIPRAWFNGELVYNKGVDSRPDWFLASRDMHILLGEDDQQPSSIMESFEGAGNVPAYRGVVGVLLDTLALGPSGQRVPNIELEVARSGTEIILVPQEWVTLPDTEALYDSGSSDNYRVIGAVPDSSRVWVILDSGGNPRRLALLNPWPSSADSEAVFDLTLDFDGNIYLQGVLSNGHALVAQEGGTAEGLHDISLVGGDTYYPGSDDFSRYVEMAQAGDTNVLRVNQAIGGHQIYTVDTDVNPLTKTNVNTGKFLNYFFTKAGAYSGRVYIAGFDSNAVTPAAARIGYIDDDGVWNTLVDYNHVGGVAYGIVGQSYLYVRSANVGEANVIEKRSHAGALVDSIALSGAGSTSYSDVYQFSLSSDESYVFVQNGDRIYKIATGTMEVELSNTSAAGTNEEFVGGSAYQGKGVIVTKIGTDDTVLKIVPPDPLLDPAPPSVADVVEDLITRSILTSADLDLTALEDIELLGYVIDQPTPIRDAINVLRPLFFFDLIESDYKIKAVLRTGSSLTTIPEAHLGARTSRDEVVDPIRITRIQEIDLPRRLTLNYISRGKDYQTGTQSTGRLATTSQQEAVISAPVVFTDEQAAKIVEKGLYEAWAMREPMDLQTSRRYSLYEPGDVWTLYNGNQVRLLDKHEGANGLIKWRGVPHYPEAYEQDDAEAVSSGGGQAIIPLSPTEAFPLDIHLLREADNYPGEYWAARGLSTRWDGAKLYVSPDGGVSYEAVPNGLIAAAAGIGVLTAAVDGPANDRYEAFDWANVVEVRMRPGVELSSYTEEQVLAGTATPLLIKREDEPGEILFYLTATNVSGSDWECTGLLRARGGTQDFVEHDAGELVVVLDSALLSVTQSTSQLFQEYVYKAPSIGSTLDQAMPIEHTNNGARLKPLAGTGLRGGFDGSGDLLVEWTPSTRIPDVIRDYADAPVGEAFERYEIDVLDGYEGDVVATYEVTAHEWTYTAAEQAVDFGSARDGYYLKVYQMSDTVGRGYPLSGWAPVPAAGAYAFYRFSSIDTIDTRTFRVGELQLIDIDGVTILTSGLTPTTNLPTYVVNSAPIVPTGMTDGNLNTAYQIDPNSTPLFATCYFQLELPYPAKLAGWKQAGDPAAIGGVNYYIRGATISGSNDGVTQTTVATPSGLSYPGHSTLSSLYPI